MRGIEVYSALIPLFSYRNALKKKKLDSWGMLGRFQLLHIYDPRFSPEMQIMKNFPSTTPFSLSLSYPTFSAAWKM